MLTLLLPSLFLYVFGLFNLLGIHQSLMVNQLVFGIFAILGFIGIKLVGHRFFRTNSKFFYWSFIALLIVTYIIGLEVKGSRRWIDLYFFSFQGSEFFKVFFILFLADYISRNKRHYPNSILFLKCMAYFALPAFIIFKQPDLGNAIVYACIFFGIILVSHIKKKYVLYTIICTLLLLPLSWFFLKGYQKNRILSFVNPHVDSQGASYNMRQALIAVGSGKFQGRGLGLGTQSRLFFLPENHTDFAYSSLVEQFGFIGGFALLILYATMTFHLIRKIITFSYQSDTEGYFKFLFTIGFFSYFICQLFVNMGMNLGLFPIAGITLPLISYGGSSLVTWMLGLALLP